MKLKGKIRQNIDPITQRPEWSFYPMDLEGAIHEDVAKYWPLTPCPVHGHLIEGKRPVYYRVTQQPGCCAHPAAVEAYNDAVSRGEPTTIHDAQQQGLTYYWASGQVHQACGHPGKTLFNGKCAFCKEDRNNSPRQQAVSAGLKWYTPASNNPCLKCHTVSPRRVVNGSCKRCEELTVERRAAASQQTPLDQQPLYLAQPKMIISREDARKLGLKWYRTGEACHAGHTGWRYVSTAGCIECKKG